MTNPAEPAEPESERRADPTETEGPRSEPEAEAPSDFGPPFEPKSFGGAFVWARSPEYVCTVLRVRERENVLISTQSRRNMQIMLTGGRGVLEIDDDAGTDRVELLPASPVRIELDKSYRLLAMTEVELFTVYTPLTD